MSETAKKQPYTYSLKSSTFVDNNAGSGVICTNGIIFYLIPPENAITIENLYMHVILQFDASIPVGQRVLKKIGIIDNWLSPVFFPTAHDRLRTLDVNIAADGNRKIDKRIDLTALLKKDDVAYRNLFSDLSMPENGYTMIYLEFDEALEEISNIGKILLWKADGLFTTQGIV